MYVIEIIEQYANLMYLDAAETSNNTFQSDIRDKGKKDNCL